MSAPELSFLVPWKGARVGVKRLRPLNFLVGRAGVGKLSFAQGLARCLPQALLLGTERPRGLPALVEPLCDPRVGGLVIDQPELGLSPPALGAFMDEVRRVVRRPPGEVGARTVVLATRSSAVVDLASLDETCSILFFPSETSLPIQVEAQDADVACRLYNQVAACLVA